MQTIRTLLVEDSPPDAELMQSALSEARFSFDVAHVASLGEATERMKNGGFDVVLLDLSLPDAKGLTSLNSITKEWPSLAIVVLTGLDDEATGIRAVQEGAQDYLVKGRFEPETLVRAIRYSIARKQCDDVALDLAREQGARAAAEDARREAEQLNRSLDETNRGILALYAELDEKTDSLRRSSEVKTRVVSNVSHEFRTPVNSILGLVRLLLTHNDGPLTPEQDLQLGYVLRSAIELSELVDDLLDLSKMESGKVGLRAAEFEVSGLFAALKGMVRPLQTRESVPIIFEDVSAMPKLTTDEGKVSQVLRNLLSNAIKFTPVGEIRVGASVMGPNVVFTVKDTGVGIAPANHEHVFEEFTQIENPMQSSVKGNGLGLSLSRRLAELLGGILTVDGAIDAGSTFTFTIPILHPEVSEMSGLTLRGSEIDPARAPVLVVEDDRQTLFLYEKYLQGSGFQVIAARTIKDARAVLARLRPAAIVLDVMLEGETSWGFLNDLKSSPETRDIPALVVTVTDRENKARALGADEFWMKPMEQEWLLKKLKQLARTGPIEKVLVIDDDEVSRYLVKRLLADTSYVVIEASGGHEGLRIAREEQPHVIFLDFVMPGMSAFEILDELKAHPRTKHIPVLIHTSKDLGIDERERLSREAGAILNKQSLSREVAIARIREALMKAGVGTSGDS